MKKFLMWCLGLIIFTAAFILSGNFLSALIWTVVLGIALYVFWPFILAVFEFLFGLACLIGIGWAIYLAFTNPALLGSYLLIGLAVFLVLTLVLGIIASKIESIPNPFIVKKKLGNRSLLREGRIRSAEEVKTLIVIEEEASANGPRPVGALAIMTNEALRERKADTSRWTARDDDKRRKNPPAFWDLVRASGTYHRAHAVPFYYCLDEGETKGITFAGTQLLDNGEPYLYQENTTEHDQLVQYLFDDFLEKYRQGKGARSEMEYGNLRVPTLCSYDYPAYDFPALEEGNLSSDHVLLNGERLGGGMPFSMMHFERLSDWIMNYFKTDEFIYSCELHYEDYDACLPSDVELILYNRTQNFIVFRSLLANAELEED